MLQNGFKSKIYSVVMLSYNLRTIYKQRRTKVAAHGATDFDVRHPPFNCFTLVAMIVPTRMCRWPHPRNCLATPLKAYKPYKYIFKFHRIYSSNSGL